MRVVTPVDEVTVHSHQKVMTTQSSWNRVRPPLISWISWHTETGISCCFPIKHDVCVDGATSSCVDKKQS
jgi:hypothetical protein